MHRFVGWISAILATSLGLAGPSRFGDVVLAHFAAWDLNHDGRIESQEIDQLMNRRSIRGEGAAALAVLKLRERHTPVSARPRFAVSRRDVEHLEEFEATPIALAQPEGKPSVFRAEGHFKTYVKMLGTMAPELYARGRPDFKAMRQGPIGDCYFFSLTGFLAARHPDRIREMITRDSRGNYVVRFFDGETYPVPNPTEAEMLVNNSSSSLTDGHWICVLEKAIGERMRKTTKVESKRTAEATDAMASGGSTAMVIALYSGHKAKSITLRSPAHAIARLEELRREIPAALHQGRLASVEMDRLAAGRSKVPGLGYHHAYAILGFDARTDTVTVWNPWGQHFQPKGPEGPAHGFVTEHGVFHVPLRTLYEVFSNVHLETLEPARPPRSPPRQAHTGR